MAFNRPLYVAYVDLMSAVDSVDRKALWKAVPGIGCPGALVNLIQDLHSNTNSQVRIVNRLSPRFTTRSGVRQGCILAPALFCRAVYWVLQKSLLHAHMKISGNWFSDTDYADDIATMDADLQSLAATLADMDHACGDLGLHISWSKTKIQNVGARSPAQTITVEGQQVEGVHKFTYLGNQLSSADGSRSDQRHRIRIASSTMQRMSHVWRQSHITLPFM